MTVSRPGARPGPGSRAVLMAGAITAIVFLICVQGSFHEGITDFDFTHVLGTAIEGTATEETGGGGARRDRRLGRAHRAVGHGDLPASSCSRSTPS